MKKSIKPKAKKKRRVASKLHVNDDAFSNDSKTSIYTTATNKKALMLNNEISDMASKARTPLLNKKKPLSIDMEPPNIELLLDNYEGPTLNTNIPVAA